VLQELDDMLTGADAARELGVTRQRVTELAQAGRIGRQVAGRYWFFTREEIEAYKNDRKVGRPKSEIELTMKHEAPEYRAA
jgi:hypothetical protein